MSGKVTTTHEDNLIENKIITDFNNKKKQQVFYATPTVSTSFTT